MMHNTRSLKSQMFIHFDSSTEEACRKIYSPVKEKQFNENAQDSYLVSVKLHIFMNDHSCCVVLMTYFFVKSSCVD